MKQPGDAMEPCDQVDALLAEANHPMLAEILMLRNLILGIDPSIAEGIKWNSMSFRTTEWFATWNKREMTEIEFVFHLGAKARTETGVNKISDPEGLLNWRGDDRALIWFRDANDVATKRQAFETIVAEWIKYV